MHNGRPLTLRKKIQLLLALTLLAWATQTLFAQWARGEQPDSQTNQAFVPRDGGSMPGAILELRSEARVLGAEVKLKQICRWSDTDAAMFAPVADVVLTKLETRRPYRVISVPDVRQMLEEAGINVALVRFSGPLECSVSRTDTELKEAEALDQWVKAHVVPAATQPAKTADLAPQALGEEQDVRTLRGLLVSDLSVRLSIPDDQLQLSFDPRDESALNLSEPPFKFNVLPRRVRDLGTVEWDVTIVSPTGSRKAQIRATARAWQNQVIVNRPLSRQQVIQNSDITERRTLVDRVPSAPPLKREQVIAQIAARDLKPGVVLTAPLVEAVPLAKVGQFITVTLDRGGVRIKTVAKALEGGCYGETISVKNEATKDIYHVTLTGPQEASLAAADRT